MKHPPIVHSLELATIVPSDAWEEFFLMCLEWAEIARQRRAARQATASEEQEDIPDRLPSIEEAEP